MFFLSEAKYGIMPLHSRGPPRPHDRWAGEGRVGKKGNMKQFQAGWVRTFSVVLTAFLAGVIPRMAVAQTLVWIDANDRRMQTRDVIGGTIHTLIQFQTPPFDYGGIPLPQVQFDPVTQKLYFLWDSSFEQVNVDGSDRETIPTSSIGIFSVNGELDRLYWLEVLDDELHWLQLDGAGSGSHAYPTCCTFAALGVRNDVFFGAGLQTNKGIWRADSDGANEQFLHSCGQPFDLDYDPVEEKLYVSNIGGIVRLNTDGSGFEQVAYPMNDVLDEFSPVAVDYQNRKVYWVDGFNPGMIRRSNLDGTNVENVITAAHVGNPNFRPRGLSIIFTPEPIPSVSQGGVLVLAACVCAAGCRLIWTRRSVSCS